MGSVTGVFSVLAKMASEGTPCERSAFPAPVRWPICSTSVTNGTNSLVSHTQLITKVYFPREMLPITYVLAGLFDCVIGFVVLLAIMSWYAVGLTAHAWNLLPIVGLLS